MQIRSLVWEDPLEKEMASHSSNFALEIPWTEDLVVYSLWVAKESGMTVQLNTHTQPLLYPFTR